MAVIVLRTVINAPADRCFNLSLSIELHQLSTAYTKEKAIAGKTSGLIELGESVTWRARHFGVWQELTSKVTALEFPHYFIDEMQQGIFKKMRHMHRFENVDDTTVMIDEFEFISPFGFLGKIADTLFLKLYLKRLLVPRNKIIKNFAETTEWKKLLPVDE